MDRAWLRGSALALVGCLALIGTASCAGAQRQTKFIEENEAIQASSAEMNLEIVELARVTSAYLEEAADEIRDESTDDDVRREALLWKVNAIPQIQAVALQPDPLVSGLDLWAFILQMRNYYTTGAGAKALGPHAAVAVSAIDKMQQSVLKTASRVSTAGGRNVRPRLEAWAAAHPIESSHFVREGLSAEYAYLLRGGQKGGLGAIDDAQASMRRLEHRVTLMSEYMPKQVRWNSELSTGDVLAVDQIQGTLGNLNTVMLDASKMLVGMPEMIRLEREAAMQSVHGESTAALASVDQQRQLVLEGITQQREQALVEVERMRARAMAETNDMMSHQLRGVVDYVFLRLAEVAAGLALLGGLIWLVWRRVGK